MQRDALAPQYVREFRCTGAKCPDNCCHSWNVAVDQATLHAYRTNPALIPVVQDKLIDNRDLTTKDATPAYIKLDAETGKCTLQEKSGLCTLQKQFGEAALCQTCASYPRTPRMLGDDLLIVLSDSCPEVARQLTHDANALELSFEALQLPDHLSVSIDSAAEDFSQRHQVLQTLLTILRHRAISFEQRLFISSLFIQRAQTLLQEGGEVSINELSELFFKLIEEGYFAQQAQQLSKKSDGALGLVILDVLRRERRVKTAFTEELQSTLDGLGIKDKLPIASSQIKQLDSARAQYLDRLEKKHPHALENLVVNWLLGGLFPIYKTDLNDGWTNIMVRYLLLRTLICGVALKQKKLDLKDLTRISYRFGRGVSHSAILNKMILELVGRNLNNTAAFANSLKA